MALNHFPHVYQPIQVGRMTLKNRIQYSPMVSNHADFVTGAVTNDLINVVRMQAQTGVGLVSIGSTPVDFDWGRDFWLPLHSLRERHAWTASADASGPRGGLQDLCGAQPRRTVGLPPLSG